MNEGFSITFRPHAPEYPREPPEKPVCTLYAKCKGCPYPSHCFICWGKDGNCIRTYMENVQKKEDKCQL